MICERCEGQGWVLDAAGVAHNCSCAQGRVLAGQIGAGRARAAWKNSKRKGASAERELAALLLEHGIPAERIPQRTGGADSPDVLTGLPLHIECKFGKRLYALRALAQAKRDAGGFPPAVFYQQAVGSPWLVTLEAEDFLELFGWVALEAGLMLELLAPGCTAEPSAGSPGAHAKADEPPARLCTPLRGEGRL